MRGRLQAPAHGDGRPLYFGKTEEPALTFGRPAWFDQVGREVAQAHERAAVFDESTFGKIDVRGADACAFLNRVCANQMDRPPGSVIYTGMLNQRGGYESDLTAVRIADDHYRLNVGTSAIRRDLYWLGRRLSPDGEVALTDATEAHAILGLMGPESPQIARAVGAGALNDLKYFKAGPVTLADKDAWGMRLSYVGEAGWEITCRAGDATPIYDALCEAGAGPAGIMEQNAMRLEKGFLSYGHDLDTDITPLEAGLEFAVAWDTDFIGRAALLERKQRPLASRVVTLVLDDVDAVPLGDEPVHHDGRIVGMTSSAGFGYRIGRPLALAYLDCDALEIV